MSLLCNGCSIYVLFLEKLTMIKTKLYLCICTCAILFLFFTHLHSINAQERVSDKIFKAGASTTNITPYLGGGIVGNFGGPPEAKYVHDELHNRCLILDDGTTKLVFVVVDNIGLKRNLIDKAKKLIKNETGIPKENILISATHTHSSVSAGGEGPKRGSYSDNEDVFDQYQEFVIRRIVDAVSIAMYNLEPATIGWGVGSVPEHVFVRRWIMKKPTINPFGEYDTVVKNPFPWKGEKHKPESTPDPDLSFISIKSTCGRPIALLANYSLHYVGGVPRNHISADYFAVFADRIQELLGADRQNPPFVGIMTNGTSGNVTNNNFGGPIEKNPAYKKMKIVAEDVAREVFRIENKIKYYNWVALDAVCNEITLKVRKPDENLIKRSKDVLNRPDSIKPIHNLEKSYAGIALNMLKWPDYINVVLQTFRIGSLGIAAIPFETFAETGIEIKGKSPFETTFTIGLANGTYGYLPTPENHELGGYETWIGTNKVEKEASLKIVENVIESFNLMQQNINNK